MSQEAQKKIAANKAKGEQANKLKGAVGKINANVAFQKAAAFEIEEEKKEPGKGYQ